MNKKTLLDVEWKGKKVFCRVDFNVPIQDGKITDDTRIRASLPTINYLLEQGAKVILASHLGRPKGKVSEEFRLDLVAKRLSELLNHSVKKLDEAVGTNVEKEVNQLKEGEVILLENVRFYAGEEKNDDELAKQFAKLADLYVNDAFGAAHRAHASTEGIAHYLPAVAGFLMEKELNYLGNALANPDRPFAAIIGGAKVKDKIGVIDNLLNKVDKLLIGGGLANTFIYAKGYNVGKSLLEADKVELAKEYLAKAEAKGVDLLIPIDVVIAESMSENAVTKVVDVEEIPDDWAIFDIGPKTVKLFEDALIKSKTVIWNGPMGVFEIEQFAKGTIAVANALTKVSGTTIIGGGDSVAAVEKAGVADKMTHISTGGGASLEFLEGKDLPGVVALEDK